MSAIPTWVLIVMLLALLAQVAILGLLLLVAWKGKR